MYDRNVEFPQRYRLQKVDGTDDIFDLIPTPGEIRNEGTLINKSSLLKDTTAALFGLDATAVPDDALLILSRFKNGIGNEHIWEKYKPVKTLVIDEYTTRNIDEAFSTASDIHMVYYADTIDDNLNLVNQSSISLSYDNASTYTSALAGKYWKYGGTLYYGNERATVLRGKNANGTYYLKVSNSAWVLAISYNHAEVSYVNSMDAAAYPPAVSDGYNYDYKGQLGNKTQIVTGNYTGTNKYGNENKNTLTFPFEPKLVIVGCLKNGGTLLILFNGATETTCKPGNSNSTYRINVEWSGNTIKWYGGSAVYQMNNNGTTYAYIAIG